jgi:DNA-binding NtrC family response regulator
MKTRILVVEDEEKLRRVLELQLRSADFEVDQTGLAEEALKLADRAGLVLTDLRLPGMSGLELISAIRRQNSRTPIVVMTAFGTVETAVEAMKKGAFDFVTKPLIPKVLLAALERVQTFKELKESKAYLARKLGERFEFDQIIGRSLAMRMVFDLVSQVAPASSTILIEGESGTGKELIANSLHHHSPRRDKPMVKVNCAALPEALSESELFGHEKGAYTGATNEKLGYFEEADGGTILLDEISDLSPAIQAKLLRVIDNQEFNRVGSAKVRKVNVRVLAATNQNLKERVKAGRFREDLFYRLNVIRIALPPLRERVEDIPLLAEHFLSRYAHETNKPLKGFSKKAVKLLREYPWPGNVRELQNAVERAVVLCKGETVEASDLPIYGFPSAEAQAERSLEGKEKEQVVQVLRETHWNLSKAAEVLGISRGTLYSKIERYGLKKEG